MNCRDTGVRKIEGLPRCVHRLPKEGRLFNAYDFALGMGRSGAHFEAFIRVEARPSLPMVVLVAPLAILVAKAKSGRPAWTPGGGVGAALLPELVPRVRHLADPASQVLLGGLVPRANALAEWHGNGDDADDAEHEPREREGWLVFIDPSQVNGGWRYRTICK